MHYIYLCIALIYLLYLFYTSQLFNNILYLFMYYIYLFIILFIYYVIFLFLCISHIAYNFFILFFSLIYIKL